jgi:hypothetical protein
MWAWTLLAQAAPRNRDPFREPEVIWGTIGLMVALLVGAFFVWLVDRWRKKSAVGSDAKEELTDFRAMYESGEITEDEYVRLRDRVSERVKETPPASRPSAATETKPAAAGPTESAPAVPPPPPPPPALGGGGDWPGASI